MTSEQFTLFCMASGCRCYLCGGFFPPQELTRDHVIPKCKGGTSGTQNILPACYPCNQKKANKYLVEKIPYRDRTNKQWL